MLGMQFFYENVYVMGKKLGEYAQVAQWMQEIEIESLRREDPLEEGMATHSSISAWRVPRTEEPGGLQSMGSHRVRQD